MTAIQDKKPYDLEKRTLSFALAVRDFTKILPKTPSNFEYIKQLIRSSSSIGANYIEANESLGKKDFGMRIRISRKEAKETIYWLHLVECDNNTAQREWLLDECTQLMKIFGAILEKCH
ncbi:MAG: hypothetical protein A3J31_01680 [Candidatus Taylorbacteria bacterium RIFCSPLOWO2_02_FULL_48_16]|nr:MAG: hypothetical protein A3J31_01680 [Candidatus Taylorbacteria bacterium RIFCSPLOWO2_02_FULL_48_16]